MLKYIIKRLFMMIFVLFGISILVFTIFHFAPGDPATIILGAGASVEDIQKLRNELGLEDPFIVRYLRYVSNALRLDFGKSYKSATPVFQEIFSRFPVTLKLTTFGILFASILGISMGVIAAVKQYSMFDNLTIFFALSLTSMPAFWVGLMLVLLVSLKWNLLPATGAVSWTSYILPTLTISSRSIALIGRMTRTTMLEVIRQDYIRTARAKGASWYRIITKHALKNALIPVITTIGTNFGYMLGAVVLIEVVFAMPGIGIYLVDSVRAMDTPIVMADVLLMGVIYSFINLTVDILYTFVDPRIRTQFK